MYYFVCVRQPRKTPQGVNGDFLLYIAFLFLHVSQIRNKVLALKKKNLSQEFIDLTPTVVQDNFSHRDT